MPGLNVARELQRRYPQAAIQFVGAGRPQERELVAAAGFDYAALPAESLETAKLQPWKFVWRNWRAVRQARALFRDHPPAAVIGLGGFASVPPVVAARQWQVPVILLEQNTVPGRATRWLCSRADVVCTSFASTATYLPASATIELTGNPVHPDIAALVASSYADQRRTLLVLGGSQGATAINHAMIAAAEMLGDKLQSWTIVHQTGINDWRHVEDEYQRLGVEHVTAPFFSDMPRRYAEAGLAVTRAGATTLAELACAGCPTIAVPYPYAFDDHQRLNAGEFVSAGAAEIVEEQPDIQETAAVFAEQIGGLLDDEPRRQEMRRAMHTRACPTALSQVVDVICRVRLEA